MNFGSFESGSEGFKITLEKLSGKFLLIIMNSAQFPQYRLCSCNDDIEPVPEVIAFFGCHSGGGIPIERNIVSGHFFEAGLSTLFHYFKVLLKF